MTDKKALLTEYRRHYQEFLHHGATDIEAQILAAQIAAHPSISEDLLRNIKNRSGVVQYAFRGLVLTVASFGIRQARNGTRQIAIDLKTRCGGVNRVTRFKGNQAIRLAALLVLKFERFEDDLVNGFTVGTVRDREADLCQMLTRQGQRIEQPDVVDNEMFRAIRRKIESEFGLHNFITTIGTDNGYRIELAPNNIVFDTQDVLDKIDSLANKAISSWYERYRVPAIQAP